LDQTLLQLTQELEVHPGQVAVAVNLLYCGATVPFVARYRKEATPSVKRCLTSRDSQGLTHRRNGRSRMYVRQGI
jgi:transcriptional accessory protein Tex/SPT6